jgi:putative transposase
MPWRQPSPMDQTTPFIADDLRDRLSMTELCERYRVSRKTGYTWVDRDLTHGPQGLEARSRRPSTSPRHTPDSVVATIREARPRQPSWGAKTLVAILRTRPPRWPWPARSTVCDILSRHGFGPKTRKRRALGPPGTPSSHMGAPHAGWRADFTGPGTTGAGRSGSPLPIPAGDRRLLLRGQALSSTRVAAATPVFTRVFNACGWPPRLRTDTGVPFATSTRARLSPLSAWGVRLGLFPAFIDPGTPPPHGRHERRHRPLKAAPPPTWRHPARTTAAVHPLPRRVQP